MHWLDAYDHAVRAGHRVFLIYGKRGGWISSF